MSRRMEICGSEVDDGGRAEGFWGKIFGDNTGGFQSEKSSWLGEGGTYEG